MGQTRSLPLGDIVQQINAALQAGDAPRAQDLLEQLGDQADPRIHAAIGGLYVRQSRWQDAIDTFDRIAKPDAGCQMQTRLAKNLLLLQDKRPQLYKLLLETPPQTLCEVVLLPSGQWTLGQTVPDRPRVLLSQGSDPKGIADAVIKSLQKAIDKHDAFLLAGVGDGYFFRAVSDCFAKAGGDFHSTVYVVEPDAEVLINAMMLHDFTGDYGPIACENFRLFVGPGWETRLRDEVHDDWFMPHPNDVLRYSIRGDELIEPIKAIFIKRQDPHEQVVNAVEAYYAKLPREELVELFGPNPPRPPRVLVSTCRFTTVLQYSSRDVEAAFKKLGWETQTLIEPSPYHRITHLGMRKVLRDFKPDLVFTIDHLRAEAEDVYPKNLPYVCWIQDNMPHLTTPQAGRSVTARDYVLGPNRPVYSANYDYPQRQWIDMGKLSKPLPLPKQWDCDGDDLVYVSNASAHGETLANRLVDNTNGDDPKRFVRRCCDLILQRYNAGGCFEMHHQILELVQGVEQELQMAFPDNRSREALVMRLVHPLNDALYRQQGLAWASSVAERLGLKLAVYGNGWSENEQFAPHARGYAAYGQNLESITRKTKINLRLEPYASLAHQRMIDGLIAGGFFLHRHNEQEAIFQGFADFLHDHAVNNAQTVQEARDAIAPELAQELENWINRCTRTQAVDFDMVQGTRVAQNIGALARSGPSLPLLDDITFTDEATFQKRVEQFLADPDLRRRTADTQRKYVEDRMTYVAGMKRMIQEIHHLLINESQPAKTNQPEQDTRDKTT